MSSTYLTRNAILKGVSAIYMVAFVSLYTQIPGLYGESGVLPAHALGGSAAGLPSLLGLGERLSLNTQHTMELLCLIGAVLGLLGVVFECGRTTLVYAAMVAMYGSLVQAGNIFLWQQGDTLLLEAGVLSVLLAPLFPWQRGQPADSLSVFLLRWLLFRVTFTGGLLKLAGGAPGWWALTALETEFESQWLPTPVAWAAHQLPPGVLRMMLLALLVTEIALPVLIFAPVRRLRLVAFWAQVVLQLATILTGNCSFYTVLVLVLCLSLVDDDWLRGKRTASGGFSGLLSSVATLAVFAAVVLGTVYLFELRIDNGGIAARTAFSKAEFGQFVQWAVPASIALAAAALLLSASEALTSALMDTGGFCRALDAIFRTLVSVVITAAIFSVTLVPYTSLDPATQSKLPTLLRDAALPAQELRVTGRYGLMLEAAGAGGRSEVVVEGAYALDGPWKEVEFRYKPGDVATAPSFATPHQPRLDWQMWYAAGGDFHGNPWLTSLAYRLLTGQPEVIRLLDVKRYPFADKPPKYIRAVKYQYKFSGVNDPKGRWWVRSSDAQNYLPTYSADHKPLLDYLTQLDIIGRPEKVREDPGLSSLLDQIRSLLAAWEPARLIWALLLTCWLLDLSRGRAWYK